MGGRKLWVFRVSGGDSFKMQIKGNPVMEHDGGPQSILRALCTEEQAGEVVEGMKAYGATAVGHCSSETLEQRKERKGLLQVLGGERNFPCQKCPECAWFDPHLESLCGAGFAFGKPGWDQDTVEGSLTSDKFREDYEECPLRKAPAQ